jgi:hypothetical protein
MYTKASIKLSPPKSMVKIANEVSLKFDERFTQFHGAMNRGALSNLSFIGSKKTSDKKRGNPKKCKGLLKRPMMKKEATPKDANGVAQKTSDEKRGNPEKHKWAHSKDL